MIIQFFCKDLIIKNIDIIYDNLLNHELVERVIYDILVKD